MCAAAKARLVWHAAPRLMRTLHSWSALHPLTAALKTLGTQVRAQRYTRVSRKQGRRPTWLSGYLLPAGSVTRLSV